MHSIVRSSLQYRFLVIVLAIVLLVSGFNQIRSMPVDVLPEFSPPFVEIQTEAPGLSAKEVEDIVTVSLEQIHAARRTYNVRRRASKCFGKEFGDALDDFHIQQL